MTRAHGQQCGNCIGEGDIKEVNDNGEKYSEKDTVKIKLKNTKMFKKKT